MSLSIEHYRTGEDAGRTDAADDQVLECRLERAVRLVAESGERDCRKGEYLDHDEHIEDIARQHKTDNAARKHEEQSIILGNVFILFHILQRIYAGDENRSRNEQSEEQAQRIDLKRNADSIAARRDTVAHPIGNYLMLKHDGLYKSHHARKRGGNGQKSDDVSCSLVLAEHDDKKRAEEQHHYGVDREVVVIKETHPLSLLISLVSSVP